MPALNFDHQHDIDAALRADGLTLAYFRTALQRLMTPYNLIARWTGFLSLDVVLDMQWESTVESGSGRRILRDAHFFGGEAPLWTHYHIGADGWPWTDTTVPALLAASTARYADNAWRTVPEYVAGLPRPERLQYAFLITDTATAPGIRRVTAADFRDAVKRALRAGTAP